MKAILQVASSTVLASAVLVAAPTAHARVSCVTALEARPVPADAAPEAVQTKPRCPQAVVYQPARPFAERADARRTLEPAARVARPVNASRA